MAIAGLIGTAISVAGSFMAAGAQQKMIREQTQASKKAEAGRQQQMQLDANHRRRQAVRESILARSQALAAGVNQGAQNGSGVAGGMGAATGMGLENQQVTNATEVLGNRVFAANREYFDATQRGSAKVAMWQGISSLGGALTSVSGQVSRLGTYFGSRPAGSTLDRTV